MNKRPPAHLPCPMCNNPQAHIYNDEAKRWRIYCINCQYDNYLKVAQLKTT